MHCNAIQIEGTTATIDLGGGVFAQIDGCDVGAVADFRWTASPRKHTTYVVSRRPSTIYLHRLILDAGKGIQVDHVDGNGLNNRRSNLRHATQRENNGNTRKRGVTSQYKGVYWNKKDNRWMAQCCGYIGLFWSEENAALAYDSAANKQFGVFAKLNFPDRLGEPFAEPKTVIDRCGEKNSRAILNADQVREILSLRRLETQKSVACRFGVSVGTIKAIYEGRIWRHLQSTI